MIFFFFATYFVSFFHATVLQKLWREQLETVSFDCSWLPYLFLLSEWVLYIKKEELSYIKGHPRKPEKLSQSFTVSSPVY